MSGSAAGLPPLAAVCPCGVCRTLSLQGTGLQPLLSCGGLRHCEYLVVFSAAQQLSSDLVTASRPSWTGSFSPKENLLICVAQAASGKVVQDGHLAGLAPHKFLEKLEDITQEFESNQSGKYVSSVVRTAPSRSPLRRWFILSEIMARRCCARYLTWKHFLLTVSKAVQLTL